MNYRIYRDNGDNTATPTGFVVDEKGQTAQMPAKNTAPVYKQFIPKGCPCLPANQIANMANQFGLPPAVSLRETPTGKIGTVRTEGGFQDQTTQAFFFTVTNNDAAAQSVLIGGGSGLLAAQLGVGEKDADVSVVGTYSQTAMYELLQSVPVTSPLDLHYLHIQSATTSGATDTTFFSLAQVSLVQANPTGNNAIINRLNFKMLGGDQFNAFLREFPEFRYQLNGNTGLWIQNIPAGLSVTFTMRISAAGLAYGMVQV